MPAIRKRKRAPRRTGRAGRWSIRLLAAVLVFFAISILLVLPLRWVNPPGSAFMLQDDSGRVPVLYRWADWEVMGSAPALAVVASEDQRFAEHFGIDLDAIGKALGESDRGGRLRGASTISQQLVKNLYLWPGRSFLRKGLEAWFTVLAEACLPKRRILEIYLNVVELGPGVYGFGAASRFFFGKEVSRLTRQEAALLAAVLPSPQRLRADRPSEYLRERQRWILSQMERLERERWLLRIG